MDNSNKLFIVVADSDVQFTSAVAEEAKLEGLNVLTAATIGATQALFTNRAFHLLGIFIGTSLSDSYGISLIVNAHRDRPGVPVFIIQGDSEVIGEISENEQKKLGIRSVFKKTVPFSEMVGKAQIRNAIFPEGVKLTDPIHLGQEPTHTDGRFVSIQTCDLLSGCLSVYDIYCKVGGNRFVKLLHLGESFNPGRVESYLTKGVQNLYVKEDLQKQYITHCETVADSIVKNAGHQAHAKTLSATQTGHPDSKDSHLFKGPDIRSGSPLFFSKDNDLSKKSSSAQSIPSLSSEAMILTATKSTQEALNFLKASGITGKLLLVGEKFINSAPDIIKQSKLNELEAFRNNMSQLACQDHALVVTTLTTMMASSFEYLQVEQTSKLIFSASMLHDIGIQSLGDPSLISEDEATMTPEQLKLYQTHPTVGAELLSQLRGINPTIVQAVAQHHMRKRSGFPSRTQMSYIHIIAEVIGICDEFARLITRQQTAPQINIATEFEKIYPLFSMKIAHQFRTAFFPKAKTAT